MALIDDYDLEQIEEADHIKYKPCKWCKTYDYIVANGNVDDNNVFEPESCDHCDENLILNIHYM